MLKWIAISVLGVGLIGLWFVLRNSSRKLLAHLTADNVGLTAGPGDQILWGDVIEVRVETTDAGPYDEDVFLVIVARGRAPLRVPSPLMARVLPQVQQLPGFDNDTFIKAMSCADNATFVCWHARS